jgi:hypothetical protein
MQQAARDDAPSVRVLARADHTRERGAVQQRKVVPEDREREERTVRHDQMRRGREGLGLLLLLSRETGDEGRERPVERTRCVCPSRIERRNKKEKRIMVNTMHRLGREVGGGWGGSVPGLHYRRRSRTGPEEIHPLTTQGANRERKE